MPWKRRSMMSKKPLLLHNMDHFCHNSCLLQLFIHTPACCRHSSALMNSGGEQLMNSSWHMCHDIRMQLFLSVSAVALMFAPSWWDCWAKVCGDLSCFAMPYRNEQKKPAMGLHPFTKKRSVNLLPDRYIQYSRSLQFHKIPMVS